MLACTAGRLAGRGACIGARQSEQARVKSLHGWFQFVRFFLPPTKRGVRCATHHLGCSYACYSVAVN
jgi:hypothetical protein